MPYKDPEKRKQAKRDARAREKADREAATAPARVTEVGGVVLDADTARIVVEALEQGRWAAAQSIGRGAWAGRFRDAKGRVLAAMAAAGVPFDPSKRGA